MRIFITGANGYIGLNIALTLRRAGHEVWGLVRSPEKAASLLRHEIRPIVGDLGLPESYLPVAERCTILIHAAMERGSEAVALDRKTIEALAGVGSRGPKPKTLIYTSGVWVYGSTGDQAAEEGTPLSPARLVTWRPPHEDLVLSANHVRGVVVRPGCVYGRQGGLTSGWFAGPAQGKSPVIVGDGRQRWTMIHVDDVAYGYLRIVESGRSSEVFNLTDRSRHTVEEMATAAARAAGYKGSIDTTPLPEALAKLGPYAECLAMDQHVDSRKAVRMLSWYPRHGGFLDDVGVYYEAWKAYQK
jgi:nucleoside-diphosphate-sugar epimerase